MNKQTQSPKKRSKLATILIGVGALVVGCCGLSAIGAVISPSKPAATPMATTAAISVKLADGVTVMPSSTPAPTAVPTAVPTDAPTAAPLPTATQNAQSAIDTYKAAIGRIAGPTSEALTQFGTLAGEAQQTPALMADTDWKLKMAVVLAAMKLHAGEFRALTAPAGLEEVDALVEQMADKLTSTADLFAVGLDEMNADKLLQANAALDAANALTKEITKRLTGGAAEPVSAATAAPTMSKRIQAAAGNPSVNIRAEPSTDAAKVGQLAAGEAAEQIGANADGTWVQVRAGGVTGWIRADLIEPFTGAPAAAVVATEAPAVTAMPTSAPAAIADVRDPGYAWNWGAGTQNGTSCICGGTDLNCADFSSWQASQTCFDKCGGSASNNVFGLDNNHNGVVCEKPK